MNPVRDLVETHVSNGMKKQITILMALAALLCHSSGEAYAPAPNQDVIVRVAIIDDKDSIRLSLKGKYKIYAADTDRIIAEGPFLNEKVIIEKGEIEIGKKIFDVPALRIKVARDSNIYIDSRRFRGDIGIVRKDNGKLMVINYIGLENYLYGVLYHEVSNRWPMECLKAQAIAARTFALYQIRQSKPQSYDLRCDIYSQMYGGRTGEKWSTTRAVDATRGKVLTFNGDIFPTYYHATCAGYTEDALNLWNMDLAPLKGVPCNYCSRSKHYRWTKELPLSQIKTKLIGAGYKIGNISCVNILSRNKSGRNDKIEIKDDAGIIIVMTGKDFRQIFGPNDIRSTKFDAEIKKDNLVLKGMGWGHGVGMCQWGAFGMSQKGKKCDEILKYYYPGTEIATIDKLHLN